MMARVRDMNEFSNDFVVLLPTHSKYKKTVENFLELFRKNWKDCPFKVVVSIVGEKIKIDNVDVIYNGKDASLIDCVVSVAKKYKSVYYISFLGDAFISEKVDNGKIADILNDIIKNKISYCSLTSVKNYRRKKPLNSRLRYINSFDRYSHNFFAFAASREFILNELARYESDMAFEKAYLSCEEEFYYNDRVVVEKNILKIIPGITKGKWDKINLKKLKNRNPEVDFCMAGGVLGFRESLIRHIRDRIVSHLSPNLRVKMKKVVEKIFKMKFGVGG